MKNSSNMIQFGIHRYRFSESTDSRWFSLSLVESAKFGTFNVNLSWNKLFTKQWERNTLLLSTNIKLFNNFYLKPGAMAYFTPEFKYLLFFLFSLSI